MESTNNFCTSCGMKLEQDDKACPICGASASKGEAAPAMPETPVIAPAPEIPPVDFSQPAAPAAAEPVGEPAAPAAGPAAPVPETPAPVTGYTQTAAPVEPIPGAPVAPPQQPGYPRPGQGYSAPVPGGYSQPVGQGGYTPPPPLSGQPIPQPIAPIPTKKSSKPAVITAIVLVIAIALGLVVYFGFIAGGNKGSGEPLQIQGEVEFGYNDDNDYMFSFTAENTTKETITYFEVWVYAFDEKGNPVVEDGYNSNWGCYMTDIYLRPGAKHTPEEDGYWFAPTDDVAYMYLYIGYIEYLNGSSTGMGLYSDVSDQVYMGHVDEISEQADAWIAQKVR